VSAVLAELPALPLHEAGKYVAGAYVVVFALVLLYVAIMALRLSRIERELGELREAERARGTEARSDPEAATR
jgi:CcmD family protein